MRLSCFAFSSPLRLSLASRVLLATVRSCLRRSFLVRKVASQVVMTRKCVAAQQLLALVLLSVPAGGLSAFAADDFEREPVNYSTATPQNVVSRLQKQIESGRGSF